MAAQRAAVGDVRGGSRVGNPSPVAGATGADGTEGAFKA
jgi:hypothetical protein